MKVFMVMSPSRDLAFEVALDRILTDDRSCSYAMAYHITHV